MGAVCNIFLVKKNRTISRMFKWSSRFFLSQKMFKLMHGLGQKNERCVPNFGGESLLENFERRWEGSVKSEVQCVHKVHSGF
jgi:hypothetical protein